MDEGKLAAQQVGLTMLATIQANLGSFNKIKRVIKVLGMVNCTPDFGKHPYVINGCSELFAAVWGPDNGVGTRSAVGSHPQWDAKNSTKTPETYRKPMKLQQKQRAETAYTHWALFFPPSQERSGMRGKNPFMEIDSRYPAVSTALIKSTTGSI